MEEEMPSTSDESDPQMDGNDDQHTTDLDPPKGSFFGREMVPLKGLISRKCRLVKYYFIWPESFHRSPG